MLARMFTTTNFVGMIRKCILIYTCIYQTSKTQSENIEHEVIKYNDVKREKEGFGCFGISKALNNDFSFNFLTMNKRIYRFKMT